MKRKNPSRKKPLSFSQILQELKHPSEWKDKDWLGLVCSAVYFLVNGYLVFEPALSHSRWSVFAVDPDSVIEILFFSVLLMLGLFASTRGFLINLSGGKQKLALAVLTFLFFFAFDAPEDAWKNAAFEDIQKSCQQNESKDAAQCKIAVMTGLKVGAILSRKGLVRIAPAIHDEEFLKKYLEKADALVKRP